ncbi:sterol desaturase family protein [Purpureocillium lavendulum]|uniref:Sterol desaturase family protein n=1 Tax=Purpureocillium lavendulum TaxID=1247861 RepID=A0AB34G1M1_9HYPO|nr:sterol desaturase family protein [Purpureocillium lavendulum]
MDLLLSLPILSYFLSPHVASWSTSLNIIFFYMTWTTLVISHPPVNVHIAGILVIRVLFWLVPSLATLAFDLSLPGVAAGLKLGGRASLPPRNTRFIAKQLGVALANLVLATFFEGLAAKAYFAVFKRTDVVTSTTLPMPMKVFRHLVMLYAAREILVYYIHRYLLHQRSSSTGVIYTWLARPHRKWAHSLGGAPYSLLVFGDHPVPSLFMRVIPVYLPAVLLRPHILTYFLFLILTCIEETVTMSGYSSVPGFIMSGITLRNSIHYATQGSGYFGAYGLLDWMSETGGSRRVLDDMASRSKSR